MRSKPARSANPKIGPANTTKAIDSPTVSPVANTISDGPPLTRPSANGGADSGSPQKTPAQIFVMDTDGSDVQRISTGKGATTCAYFLGGDERVLFASTHEGMPDCPKRPDYSQGYVWPIHASYEIYSSLPDGSDLKPLTRTDGYDAEATVSPDGKSIVFTSERDGDLELYRMDPDGGNVKRLTNSPGYDGGAFYSYDSKKIIYRGYHPTDVKELKEFKRLLSQHLVRPSIMEIFVMDADGKNIKQVTDNGAANFCPFFHPDGKRIIFASNLHDGGGHNFDLFMIGLDGEGLERITFNDSFDAFPMFSPDGKSLVFGSNRHNAKRGDTNIFIADWVEKPEGPKHPKKAPAEPGKKKG